MELLQATTIYQILKKSQHQTLVNSLLSYAIRYSRLRVDWLLADVEKRHDMDNERTASHNAFISACDILARNMTAAGEDATWRRHIGTDRKDIGDFACLLHAVMGVAAR
jgi:hypothetical protein